MITEKIQWHHAVPGVSISSNEVHVWRVFPGTINFQTKNLAEILSADELARAEKFHFERDQRSFIIARGVLRMILGGYLDKNPHQLRFEYTSLGKPVLAEKIGNATISFNLSHSDDVALYGVTLNRNIGIDVERIKDNVDVIQIANRFFSFGEINALERCNVENQAELFFKYWTRKEALVKAMGKGVSFPLEQCDVSLINGKTLSPIKLTGTNTENSCLYVQDLFPGEGYVAAIATEGADLDISYRHYQC